MDLERAYKVLGLKRKADFTTAKKTYRKLAMKYHPDVNRNSNATKMFEEITEAYNAITEKNSDIKQLIGSDYEILSGDFLVENEEVLSGYEESTYDSLIVAQDVEKFIYITREEADTGKKMEVQYMIEKYIGRYPEYSFEKINLVIPRDVAHGKTICFEKKGNYDLHGKRSDLNIIIEIEENQDNS